MVQMVWIYLQNIATMPVTYAIGNKLLSFCQNKPMVEINDMEKTNKCI